MRHHVHVGLRLARKKFWVLLKNPIFIFITLLGSCLVLIASLSFFYFERPQNPQIENLFDCFYLSMTTITTVGYGDIPPLTVPGRITALVLMVAGTGIFATYIAMMTSLFSSIGIEEIERELEKIRKELEG